MTNKNKPDYSSVPKMFWINTGNIDRANIINALFRMNVPIYKETHGSYKYYPHLSYMYGEVCGMSMIHDTFEPIVNTKDFLAPFEKIYNEWVTDQGFIAISDETVSLEKYDQLKEAFEELLDEHARVTAISDKAEYEMKNDWNNKAGLPL